MALPEHIINPGGSYPALAGAAIGQYDCVKLGAADGKVIKTSAANDAGIGFIHTGKATAADDHVTIYYSGVVWARAAGSITAGDLLEATADGEVTTETPADGIDQNIVGRALTASAGANELVAVLIMLFMYNDETVA
jgi:hypothetical protein